MECQTYTEKTLSAYRQVFNFPQYDQIDAGNIENMNNGGGEYQWAINSFFGRLNYNYKERYLVEANIRTDGSSRFAEGNRYGVFLHSLQHGASARNPLWNLYAIEWII